jgi:hypothetical protein
MRQGQHRVRTKRRMPRRSPVRRGAPLALASADGIRVATVAQKTSPTAAASPDTMCTTTRYQPCPRSPTGEPSLVPANAGSHRFIRNSFLYSLAAWMSHSPPPEWRCRDCSKVLGVCEARCEAQWQAWWAWQNGGTYGFPPMT